MRSARELLASFTEEYRRIGDADPATYLEQARPQDRPELLVLIDAFLARQPRRRSSAIRPEEADRWRPRSTRSSGRSLAYRAAGPSCCRGYVAPPGSGELEVVEQLAAALDVSAKHEKVALYYHEIKRVCSRPKVCPTACSTRSRRSSTHAERTTPSWTSHARRTRTDRAGRAGRLHAPCARCRR